MTDKTTNNIIILNNDCILELNKMNDNSIDCVITDPPYSSLSNISVLILPLDALVIIP